MPEDKKTVDIDTTGPGAEVELPEEKDKAVVTETAPEPEKEKDEKLSSFVKETQLFLLFFYFLDINSHL